MKQYFRRIIAAILWPLRQTGSSVIEIRGPGTLYWGDERIVIGDNTMSGSSEIEKLVEDAEDGDTVHIPGGVHEFKVGDYPGGDSRDHRYLDGPGWDA